MHHYRHHIGDYRKDTAHLTILEHGVYRQALDLYYTQEGPLTSNMRQLMRLLCVRTADERQALENVLADFFKLTDNGYEHQRCQREIAEFYEKSEKARESARIRWERENAGMREACLEDANASGSDATARDFDATAKKSHANDMLPNYPTTQLPNINPSTVETTEGTGAESDSGGEQPDLSDKKRHKSTTEKTSTKKPKFKYSTDQHQLAVWMSNPVKARFGERQKINLEEWADAVRKLMEIDGYTTDEIEWLWRQVVNDERQGFCWSMNCRTPMKLREKKDGLPYFEIIRNQFKGRAGNGSDYRPGGNSEAARSGETLPERVKRKSAERLRSKGIDP